VGSLCRLGITGSRRCPPHTHSFLDISDLANVREVSRITFDDKQWPPLEYLPMQIGAGLVVDSGGYGANMIFIVNFDPKTGSLVLDEHFRDPGSNSSGHQYGWQDLAARFSRRCLPAWRGILALIGPLSPSMRRPVRVKSRRFCSYLNGFFAFEPSRLCRHPSIRSLL